MIISKAGNYALRAALYVAFCHSRRFIPINEIANHLGISFHFLTKILQELTAHSILTSFRGPQGGVAFCHSPDTITLYDIIISIDGPSLFEQCLISMRPCLGEDKCPLHTSCSTIRHDLYSLLNNYTISNFLIQLDKLKNISVEQIFGSVPIVFPETESTPDMPKKIKLKDNTK